MTSDSLHPSLPGYQIWIDAIQPTIDRFFPAQAASQPARRAAQSDNHP